MRFLLKYMARSIEQFNSVKANEELSPEQEEFIGKFKELTEDDTYGHMHIAHIKIKDLIRDKNTVIALNEILDREHLLKDEEINNIRKKYSTGIEFKNIGVYKSSSFEEFFDFLLNRAVIRGLKAKKQERRQERKRMRREKSQEERQKETMN